MKVHPVVQKVQARHWSPMDGDSVKCLLCPNSCVIREGKSGICGTRRNRKGILMAEGYGIYPAVHLDPIEKKPLNHFLPGSSILSVGSLGCNLRCLHCQNWSLSTASPEGMDGHFLAKDELVSRSLRRGSVGVAFTYNEPTINFEYLMDVLPLLKGHGAKVVLVTNGYLSKGPWNELMGMTDGANIDVKGFTEGFYKEVTGGSLRPVLDNIISSYKAGVHVEIAYLMIPKMNDDTDQLRRFIEWSRDDVSPSIPVHFNRFHPDHLLTDIPATPPETLFKARDMAREMGLEHVYVGNVQGHGTNNTKCPGCGTGLIDREGFFGVRNIMKKGSCPGCGRSIYGAW